MEYLLVLQLPSSSPEEDDLLISLEEATIEGIGDFGTVDGHDMGSGEMNIFLFTENPKSAFGRIKTILPVMNQISKMKVGYREIGEDEYSPIFPQGLKQFVVA